MDCEQTLVSLQPLLHSNLPPLPQQSSDITAVVSHFSEQLDGIESRIALLQNELSQLGSSKAGLQKDIEKYTSILSANRRIPPEIIRTFMLGCHDELSFDHYQARDLALVSRQWYQVAVSTPRLWTSYTIDTRDASVVGESGPAGATAADPRHDVATMEASVVSQVSAHFSKALSLPVCLHYMFNGSNLRGGPIFHFIQTLAPRLERFHIYLHVKKAEEVDPILTKLLGQATWPILWSLDINLRIDHGDVNRWCGDVFTGSQNLNRFPAIKYIGLQGVGEQYMRGQRKFEGWNMPWSQLSSMRLGPLPLRDAQDIVNILNDCTNLQECFIDITRCSQFLGLGASDITDRSKPIELAKLRCLHLSTDNEWVSKGILDRLALPSLQRLTHALTKENGFKEPNPSELESDEETSIDYILKPLIDLFTRSSCRDTMIDLTLNLDGGLSAISYIPDNTIISLHLGHPPPFDQSHNVTLRQ